MQVPWRLPDVEGLLRTFMGITIHNYSIGDPNAGESGIDLAAALRMDASGILGTTVQYGDLVSGYLDPCLTCSCVGKRRLARTHVCFSASPRAFYRTV